MRGPLQTDEPLGVYLSVPFCRAKCSFCNFASGVGTGAAIERYVGQLCAEIGLAREATAAIGAELPRRVDTVYFGGGTPSLLEPEQLRRIFASLREGFDIDANAEITLEAAPMQIADPLLEEAMRQGVNRISLGVQSFIDREAAAVGRLHTEQECVQEIARLRAAGVEDVGADLIAGLPYQTPESWRHSLETAAACGLAHVSVYMLEVDEDSRLGNEVLAGGQRFHAHAVLEEDRAAELYEAACGFLPRHGFAQYEISNFARDGQQSRHNVKYWRRAPYIGFGLDAHSMLRAGREVVRFANADELLNYPAGRGEMRRVSEREAFEEAVFLGLRMCEGIDVRRLREQFDEANVRECERVVAEMAEAGWVSAEDDRWRLTLRGRLVSNEVFGRLLEGAPALEGAA